MKLFQYWNDAEPPEDVAKRTRDIRRDNPDFEYMLLNEASALKFIADYYGSRELLAFRACGHPAMQSDLLRLLLLDTWGGFYLDADHQGREPLAGMVAEAPHALIPLWKGAVANNGVMMFRNSGDSFVRACLELALENIQSKRFRSIPMATGPGAMNAVRAVVDLDARKKLGALAELSPWLEDGWPDLLALAERTVRNREAVIAALQRITWMESDRTLRWLGILPAAYKQTEQHWLNYKGSIYR